MCGVFHFQSSFGQPEALGKVSDSFTLRKAASLRASLTSTDFRQAAIVDSRVNINTFFSLLRRQPRI